MNHGSNIDEDYRFVEDIHGDVSRTFELALENLPEDLTEVVRTSYLLCRIPDTIEDSGNIPVEEKPDLLDQYLDVLHGGSAEDFVENSYEALDHDANHWDELDDLEEDSSYWELLENTDRVFNVFEQFDPEIRQSVEENAGEMVEGMRDVSSEIAESETDGIRIDNLDELADYNYIVAGTVGNLLTDIFTHKRNFGYMDEERLYDVSEDFGHFLQTINIIKDPYDDYTNEDAVFVPDSLDGGDFHEEVIAQIEGREADTDLLEDGISELSEHAEESREKVIDYIDIVENKSEEIGSYLQVPALLATATLREAKENPLDAFQEEGISIEKAEALTINDKAGGWEDTATAMERIGEKPVVSWSGRFKAGLHDLSESYSRVSGTSNFLIRLQPNVR